MAEIIKFDAGKAELIALKFDAGKNCVGRFGPQVQFTTTDERIFWLDTDPANDVEGEIRKLGIRTGQEFWLTKVKTSHGGFRWVVERTPDARRDAGGHNVPERSAGYNAPPAPPPPPVYTPAPPVPNPITPASAKLMAAYMSAIDTLVEAQAYAARKGLAIAFNGEDVRSTAISCYISACKEGGR